MKIIIDDKIPYIKGALESIANVVYLSGSKISRNDLLDADALIIRTRTICNKQLLEGTNVKFIATATIGYDHIDTNYCKDAGIAWTNAPGCNSGSVQQYIASALVHLSNTYNCTLKDKTIGIVGVGNVGSKVEKIARAFGMRILLNDPPRERMEGSSKFVSLDKICKEADIITFHIPLNKDGINKTFHIADEMFFKKIKQGTFIINSSRGEVIKTSAIKEALKRGTVSSAIIDVWENEPTIDLELLKLTTIATPHIAGYSRDGKAGGTTMSIQALSRHFNLGIDYWQSSEIEKPEHPNINIDVKNKNIENVLKEAIQATFNIKDDDENLRISVASFEKQREDYPIRREFHAYNISILPSNDETIKEKLREIGFNI